MVKAIELVDRRIASHLGAVETLRALRAEMETALGASAPAPTLAPVPAPKPVQTTPFPTPAPVPPRRATVSGRKPGDPPPPPGVSIRDRIIEQLQKYPDGLTAAAIIAQTKCVAVTIYDNLRKMRDDGTVVRCDGPNGEQKHCLRALYPSPMEAVSQCV